MHKHPEYPSASRMPDGRWVLPNGSTVPKPDVLAVRGGDMDSRPEANDETSERRRLEALFEEITGGFWEPGILRDSHLDAFIESNGMRDPDVRVDPSGKFRDKAGRIIQKGDTPRTTEDIQPHEAPAKRDYDPMSVE